MSTFVPVAGGPWEATKVSLNSSNKGSSIKKKKVIYGGGPLRFNEQTLLSKGCSKTALTKFTPLLVHSIIGPILLGI